MLVLPDKLLFPNYNNMHSFEEDDEFNVAEEAKVKGKLKVDIAVT